MFNNLCNLISLKSHEVIVLNRVHVLCVLQVIDSSQVSHQVLASLQPVTLQGGKLVAVTPASGATGGDGASMQTITLSQLAQATAQHHNSIVSVTER